MDSINETRKKLNIPALRGQVLGIKVYRGYCKLCDLAKISKPDIYHKVNNPNGTQRDLNPTHAKEAYEYVKTHELGFWPEVFLNIRNKEVVTFTPISDEIPDMGILEIDLSIALDTNQIAISRVDGNHRLFFASGQEKNFPAIEKIVSFCMAYELTNIEEIRIFKDINDNQKAMNTSHLDNIEVRLTPEELLKRKSPDLYIAQKLGNDSNSPLFNRIYEGGVKLSSIDIPLRSMRTGIEYMLSRSTQLPRLENIDAQYKVIRNFFIAVKKWQPNAWTQPKDYIVLRGVGLWSICFIGANVIDICLNEGNFETDEMFSILTSGKEWDWRRNGDFIGYSGRAGALEISKSVTKRFIISGKVGSQELLSKIMNSN